MVGFTPQRIIVPVSGAHTDAEAVRLGCRLARRAKAKVMAITVLEIRRSLALGTVQDLEMDRAETILDEAEKRAREIEVEIETELLQARARVVPAQQPDPEDQSGERAQQHDGEGVHRCRV